TEITRNVPGSSSAGRARMRPWRAIHSIVPYRPRPSQSARCASSSARSMPVMPQRWKPPSRASSRIREARAAGSDAPAAGPGVVAGAGDGSTMRPSIESAGMPAPDRLYSTHALRELEARGIADAGDPRALMVRAGQAAWRAVLERWPGARRLLVACGPGDNGGDGYELAHNALRSGREVQVVQLGDAGGSRAAREAWAEAGGTVVPAGEELPGADVIVDALFGIGLSRPLEGGAAALVRGINGHPAPVLALDVPSGVDADTGHAAGAAVAADHTIEFLAPKVGLRTGAARDLAGTLSLADLQVPPDGVDPSAERLDADDLARWLPPRR